MTLSLVGGCDTKPAGDLFPSGETGRISECSDVVAAPKKHPAIRH